ncbi:MAG: hypothetical protein ACAI35_24090 [Candidatus Methylacidiphilales bacterium]|nr:hypothetical protein [Candidatus Methylacidiphilales bacterium]
MLTNSDPFCFSLEYDESDLCLFQAGSVCLVLMLRDVVPIALTATALHDRAAIFPATHFISYIPLQ